MHINDNTWRDIQNPRTQDLGIYKQVGVEQVPDGNGLIGLTPSVYTDNWPTSQWPVQAISSSIYSTPCTMPDAASIFDGVTFTDDKSTCSTALYKSSVNVIALISGLKKITVDIINVKDGKIIDLSDNTGEIFRRVGVDGYNSEYFILYIDNNNKFFLEKELVDSKFGKLMHLRLCENHRAQIMDAVDMAVKYGID